jgi:rRNA maturation endonuclease Nob1
MEVKKVETVEPKSKEIELAVCDECEEEVPIDASFCPYCGAEFEEEDEDESEEESED